MLTAPSSSPASGDIDDAAGPSLLVAAADAVIIAVSSGVGAAAIGAARLAMLPRVLAATGRAVGRCVAALARDGPGGLAALPASVVSLGVVGSATAATLLLVVRWARRVASERARREGRAARRAARRAEREQREIARRERREALLMEAAAAGALAGARAAAAGAGV